MENEPMGRYPCFISTGPQVRQPTRHFPGMPDYQSSPVHITKNLLNFSHCRSVVAWMSSGDLLCSICMDAFSDPVSTPCGHNFCKICLSTYWNSSQDCRCPNCNETFDQRPDLRINTTFRELVDEHKKKIQEEQARAEVVCDICTEGKLKAVKSCLVCQSSYCETHLEPHLRVSGLQKHKLIDPVKNLQDYICQKHERPLELFCRDDQTRVCLICTLTDHKNHNTVPIRASELQEMMEERQRGAETHNEGVIKYLEQEISEMKKKDAELKKRNTEQQDKISNTEYNLFLLEEQHEELLSRQKKFSSVDLCKIIIGIVLLVLYIIASARGVSLQYEITELQKRNSDLETDKAARLEFLEKEITELQKRNSDLETDKAESGCSSLQEQPSALFTFILQYFTFIY